MTDGCSCARDEFRERGHFPPCPWCLPQSLIYGRVPLDRFERLFVEGMRREHEAREDTP